MQWDSIEFEINLKLGNDAFLNLSFNLEISYSNFSFACLLRAPFQLSCVDMDEGLFFFRRTAGHA